MGPYSLSYWVAFRVPFSAELKEQIAEAESGRRAGSPKLQASDEIDAMLARRGKAAEAMQYKSQTTRNTKA